MIATALLLLGSCGSASRTIEVEPEIRQIVWRVILGGVKDAIHSGRGGIAKRMEAAGGRNLGADACLRIDDRPRAGSDGGFFRGIERAWQSASPRLHLDGRQVSGIFAWLAAINRVAGYALDRADERTARTGHGSVCYEYRLRLRGFDIRRSTRIEDGHVSLVTDAYGKIGPRGELYRVQVEINAREITSYRTRIAANMAGWSEIGKRCGLVNRIASRKISTELAKALQTIERGGIDLYRSADACLERLLPR